LTTDEYYQCNKAPAVCINFNFVHTKNTFQHKSSFTIKYLSQIPFNLQNSIKMGLQTIGIGLDNFEKLLLSLD